MEGHGVADDENPLPAVIEAGLPDTAQQELVRSEPSRPGECPVVVYLDSLAPGSRRTIHQALDRMASMVMGNPLDDPFRAEWFHWAALRFQHTNWIRSRLAEELAPATANKCLAALKGVLKASWRLGFLSAEDFHRAIDLSQVRGSRLPPGRMLSIGEMRAFFEDCARDRSRGAVLDAALFAALAGAGLRRGEVTALDVEHFDGSALLLRVRGKGNKEREVPLETAAVAAISLWVNVRGFAEGALFCPVRKGDKLELRRMSEQAVYKRMERRALRAGIKQFTPHDLRRTYASGMMDGGADIVAVQRLLGHADISTTVKYDRRDEKAKRRAAELFHLPYVAFEPKLEGRDS